MSEAETVLCSIPDCEIEGVYELDQIQLMVKGSRHGSAIVAKYLDPETNRAPRVCMKHKGDDGLEEQYVQGAIWQFRQRTGRELALESFNVYWKLL